MPKPKKVEEGAPMWIVTYGDMMSLLLCFFIMLAALANYDSPNPRLQAALDSIRQALGMRGQMGKLVDPSVDFQSMIRQLEAIVKTSRLRHTGRADVKGVDGKELTIRQIRDGAEIMIGGPIAFERFSADLRPEARDLIIDLAGELAGHLNVIEVRGHATAEPLPADSPYRDPMDLSLARARAVQAQLIEGGVNPRTIRVVGCGSHEPILRQAYTRERMAVNRRVEIIVRESVIAEFDGKALQPDTTTAPAETTDDAIIDDETQ